MAGQKLLTLGLIDRGAPVNVTTSEASRSWKKWEAFRETTSAQGALFVGLEASAAAPSRALALRVTCASGSRRSGARVPIDDGRDRAARATYGESLPHRGADEKPASASPAGPGPCGGATGAEKKRRQDCRIARPPFKDFSPVVVDLDLDWANLDVTVGAEHGVPGGVAGGVPGGLVGGPAPQQSAFRETARSASGERLRLPQSSYMWTLSTQGSQPPRALKALSSWKRPSTAPAPCKSSACSSRYHYSIKPLSTPSACGDTPQPSSPASPSRF